MAVTLIPRPSPNREPAEYMDPEKIFRTRYELAVSHSYGIERYAYKLIPYNLLRSFALTFDPREKWRVGQNAISPVSRTRTMATESITDLRSAYTSQIGEQVGQATNTLTCVPQSPTSIPTNVKTNVAVSNHPKRIITVKDTTRRTRPLGSSYGEFELFKYTVSSPDRSVVRVSSSLNQTFTAPCTTPTWTRANIVRRGSVSGGSAIFSQANITTIQTEEIARLTTVMQQNAARLFSETLPTSRRYSLVRNVIELRDLPRSVLSLRASVEDLRRISELIPRGDLTAIFAAKTARHVPEQYVSFWFGWRQIYNDLLGLLSIPQRISKEVNYLIDRNGKATTLRTTKKFPGVSTTSPAFTYDPLQFLSNSVNESNVSVNTVHTRTHELRLVINATFDFPSIGEPKFREDFFLKKLGAVPTLTDVYNLTPWTWLFDWFTGLGNYIELIDVINTDPSLINYGFITGVTHGSVVTAHRSTVSDVHDQITSPPTVITTTTSIKRNSCESRFEYKLQIRKNLRAHLTGVRSILEPSSLTSYQNSIIGAILLSRRG